MIRYADEKWDELVFEKIAAEVERRDDQWIDVTLRVETAASTPLPDDVIDLSILIVCTHDGHPLQAVVLEEGCDSEYQLTESEKEQLFAYVRKPEMHDRIRQAATVV